MKGYGSRAREIMELTEAPEFQLHGKLETVMAERAT